MAKVTIRHSKKLSEHELKRQMSKLRQIDVEESLEECIQELQRFEKRFDMSSVEFYQKYRAGKMGDKADVMRWAGTYETYLLLMRKYFLPHAKAQ